MERSMSQTPSVKSRVDEMLEQVQAEEEEKMSMTQSQYGRSIQGDPDEQNSDKEDEDAESDDSEGHNVFYKPSELIVSPTLLPD